MPAVVANVALNLETRGVPQKLREVQTQAQQTEKAFNGITAAASKLASAFALLQGAKFIFAKTAELESQTKSLQVLTGSVEQAKQIIQELQQLGAVTPFTSTELIDAAKRLQAFGVQGNQVVEVTRRLADASGATGAELQGLVTAYGQVVAKGRLQGEELLQFQERGVGVQQELQKMYKLSGEELQKALSKGQISAKAVEIAFQRLTSEGGKYANGAAAQSDTLSGKLSTLQDGVDALARRLGQVLTPALKAIFNQAIAVVDAINQALAAGRGGGFTRSVFGARQALNVGATGQAVKNIAEGIGQINTQRNKAGISQNLQALQQYQRLLQSIGPDDPNSNKAVQLQGVILKKIEQNINAQKQLNKQTTGQAQIFEPPPLAAPSGGADSGSAEKTAKKLQQELQKSVEEGDRLGREYSRQVLQLAAITEAEQERNRIQSAYEDRALDIKDLKNEEQKINLTALNDEIRRLELQKLQTEELKKQAAEYIKLIPIFAQFNEDLGALAFKGGPLGAGIGGNVGVAFGGTSLIGAPQNEELTKAKEALNALVDPINQVKTAATSIGNAFTDSFSSVITGSMSAQEALAGFFKNVANSFLDMAGQIITQLIVIKSLEAATSIFGGGGGFKGFSGAGPVAFPGGMNIGIAGFKAAGGPVGAGKTYMVGEKGPELFVPSSSGNIVPNNQLGGGPTSVVVNVDASGSNVQGDQSQASQLGKVIGLAVQQELIKQKRPGGLLA